MEDIVDLLHLKSKIRIIHNPEMIIHTTWEMIMHNHRKRVPILVGAPPFFKIAIRVTQKSKSVGTDYG